MTTARPHRDMTVRDSIASTLAITAVLALFLAASFPWRAFSDGKPHDEPLLNLAKYAPTSDFYERSFGLISFNGSTRCPRWTLEVLDKFTNIKGADREGMSFHVDPQVPREFASRPADYEHSGYDEFHHAAAGNHCRSLGALKSTFTIANAAPGTPELNRGPWKELEEWIRSLAAAKEIKRIWVLTAPAWLPETMNEEVATGDNPGKCVYTYRFKAIGKDRVQVPTHFGKSILIEQVDKQGKVTLEMHSWLLPNEKDFEPGTFDEYLCTTDGLERTLGLDLWQKIPEPLQSELESEK